MAKYIFRNFRRLGSDFEVNQYPKDIVRKSNSLQTLEFIYLLLGITIFLIGVILLLGASDKERFFIGGYIGILGWLQLRSGWLLAMDNWRFRRLLTASNIQLLIPAAVMPYQISLLICAAIMIVSATLYIPVKNKAYFEWTKSLDSPN